MWSLKDWPDRFGCILLGHNEVIPLCVFIELNKVETTKELVTLRNRKLSPEALHWVVINALRLSIPPNKYISCEHSFQDLWANIHYWSMHLFNQTCIKWMAFPHTSQLYFFWELIKWNLLQWNVVYKQAFQIHSKPRGLLKLSILATWCKWHWFNWKQIWN